MMTVGLMGIATEPWHLLGLRLIEGAFTGTVTASTALVAASAPKDKLGYSLGLISMAVFSGASLTGISNERETLLIAFAGVNAR